MAPVRSGTNPSRPHMLFGPTKTSVSSTRPIATRRARSRVPSFVGMSAFMIDSCSRCFHESLVRLGERNFDRRPGRDRLLHLASLRGTKDRGSVLVRKRRRKRDFDADVARELRRRIDLDALVEREAVGREPTRLAEGEDVEARARAERREEEIERRDRRPFAAAFDGLVRMDDIRSDLGIDALAAWKCNLDVFHGLSSPLSVGASQARKGSPVRSAPRGLAHATGAASRKGCAPGGATRRPQLGPGNWAATCTTPFASSSLRTVTCTATSPWNAERGSDRKSGTSELPSDGSATVGMGSTTCIPSTGSTSIRYVRAAATLFTRCSGREFRTSPPDSAHGAPCSRRRLASKGVRPWAATAATTAPTTMSPE